MADSLDPVSAPPSAVRAAVVVLAAGDGRRVGTGTNKVLLPLAGVPVLAWSLRQIVKVEYLDQVVVTVREQDRAVVEQTLRRYVAAHDFTIVRGASTRHGSEHNALLALAESIDSGQIDVVAIHDAARPLAPAGLFTSVVDAAAQHGGALPVRPEPAVLLRDPSVFREPAAAALRGANSRLVGVQTPQAFRAAPLLDAYRQAARDGFEGTDTASCIEKYTDLDIHCVPSPATNLKVTYPEDLAVAERLLGGLSAGSAGSGEGLEQPQG